MSRHPGRRITDPWLGRVSKAWTDEAREAALEARRQAARIRGLGWEQGPEGLRQEQTWRHPDKPNEAIQMRPDGAWQHMVKTPNGWKVRGSGGRAGDIFAYLRMLKPEKPERVAAEA